MVAQAKSEVGAREPIDVNAIVSYNLAAIRELRGWTQIDFATKLGELTGRRVLQASVSAMERAFDGDRRCLFDAQELYLLSVVFDVPIVYFFLPPPGLEVPLAGSGRPLPELWAAVLGADKQLAPVDHRLAEIGAANPTQALGVLAATAGAAPDDIDYLVERFPAWREERLAQLEWEYGPRLAAAEKFLTGFVAAVKATRAQAFQETIRRQPPVSEP